VLVQLSSRCDFSESGRDGKESIEQNKTVYDRVSQGKVGHDRT
jgi:hypothetical protein